MTGRSLDGLTPLEREALGSRLLRPPPEFSEADLSSLLGFVVSSGMRPEGAGSHPFDISERPYLTELYAERRDKPMSRAVIMKAAQTGLTVKLLYRAAWLCADARRQVNTALLFPSKDSVLELHKSRFRPMMHSSSRMMRLIQDVDSVDLVRIGVSNMRFRGMRSGIGIDSFPADALLYDEVRLMALSAIDRAMVRVSKSKLVHPDLRGVMVPGIIELNSTAGFPGQDIDAWFQQSDMRYWRTPCPNMACRNHREGIVMPLRWPDCVGQSGSTLYYQCPDCLEPLPDAVLMRQGFYRAENPDGHRGWVGYQFSQIVNGNSALPELYAAFTRGHNLAEFYNSRLGIPWQDPNAVPATEAVVRTCIDPLKHYAWPRPEDLTGDWVAMGIDQRAPEKHFVMYKLGPGGSFDLVHLGVVEASGAAAVAECARLALEWRCKIVVVDGEPSYDFAVDLARALPRGMVWLSDYVEDAAQGILFVDDSQKKGLKKVSGEVKYEQRVLVDRYKGMDWALTRFSTRRIRLPYDFDSTLKTQARTHGGITGPVKIVEEYLSHLGNIARAAITRYDTLEDGQKVKTGKIRMIYRHLALDPHFAHATLSALVGVSRRSGAAELTLPEPPSRVRPDNQLETLLPYGERPSDFAAALADLREHNCGNCRFFERPAHGLERPAHGLERPARGLERPARGLERGADEGFCRHETNGGRNVVTAPDAKACPVWERA